MTKQLLAVLMNAADKKTAAEQGYDALDILFGGLKWTLLFLVVLYLSTLLMPYVMKAFSRNSEELTQPQGSNDEQRRPQSQPPKVSFNESSSQPKHKGNALSLDSVSSPIAKPTNNTQSHTSPPAATTVQDPLPVTPSSSAPASVGPATVGPGDFEKSLAHAGQRMDTLLAQTIELTHLLKLSEKAKTEATTDLSKAVNELKSQISLKDTQIAKLENLLDRKSTYPSLHALIEIKKLCLDMIGTQKPLAHDDLIAFVAGAVDSQLEKLDVQSADFPVGTPLDKIPGEQVENSPRHEATDDQARHNQVARLLRPCYYLERDSKRIVIAKAVVVLYRFSAPAASSPETSQS